MSKTETSRPTGGAIDIVVNLRTPRELREGSLGIDPGFMAQLRMLAGMRNGVPMPAYIRKMDRAGIERSLLVAALAGDFRETRFGRGPLWACPRDLPTLSVALFWTSRD